LHRSLSNSPELISEKGGHAAAAELGGRTHRHPHFPTKTPTPNRRASLASEKGYILYWLIRYKKAVRAIFLPIFLKSTPERKIAHLLEML
jgi:hypothetical protein